MGVRYERVPPNRITDAFAEAVGAVHQAAFKDSVVGGEYPGHEVAAGLRGQACEPGFRFHGALDEDGRLVGFAYGYTDYLEPPTDGWLRMVADAVATAGHDGWLDHGFGFAWFAVLPDLQGYGIGSQLHNDLFAGAEHERAWLVCPAHEAGLREFYRRRGWVELAFSSLGSDTERAIMGLALIERPSALTSTPFPTLS